MAIQIAQISITNAKGLLLNEYAIHIFKSNSVSTSNIVCKYVHESVVQLDSFIPLARAEWDDCLPFSGAPSIPFCYIGCIT